MFVSSQLCLVGLLNDQNKTHCECQDHQMKCIPFNTQLISFGKHDSNNSSIEHECDNQFIIHFKIEQSSSDMAMDNYSSGLSSDESLTENFQTMTLDDNKNLMCQEFDLSMWKNNQLAHTTYPSTSYSQGNPSNTQKTYQYSEMNQEIGLSRQFFPQLDFNSGKKWPTWYQKMEGVGYQEMNSTSYNSEQIPLYFSRLFKSFGSEGNLNDLFEKYLSIDSASRDNKDEDHNVGQQTTKE